MEANENFRFLEGLQNYLIGDRGTVYDGNFIAEYRGQNEAGRLTGISGANISQVCNGKRASAGGYLWTYKNNNNGL